MKVGIFGGSFNPIHNGHVALAKSLLGVAGLDEIWFMVSPQNPLKNAPELLDEDIRLEMVRAALSDEPRLVASDYEFALPRPSYTWNTLTSLSRAFPHIVFSLLIGGDNWQCFHKWYRSRDIIANYPIVVYPRCADGPFAGTVPVRHENPGHVTFADTPLLDISSTEVRKRIAGGKSIAGMVPPEVEAIITDRCLYARAF
ncbi:nicotinate (nicotinamide) nucleotide adenylyltransferase [Xylanibacter muris]|uniref:Probable nicotinate-nucleotide adenylyltransferase n=1 Tax=Xylanibacter muris TaxID=2736290 RepID=A0ABX2ALL8_9BACT|nr:nicotinate (nicotinamide) nucleotide adenylyltransferase [Xylanibacter muris]NPD91090.1 nicotinate-nucleotide adenylyltransferase [Xylanibacter muris]